jgi:hypothetical protein
MSHNELFYEKLISIYNNQDKKIVESGRLRQSSKRNQ